MSELRTCVGSTRFGIEPHEAPVTEFPAQPSQKDGLGRMCKPHWRQYTTALRHAAEAARAASTAAEAPLTPTVVESVVPPEDVSTKHGAKASKPTIATTVSTSADARPKRDRSRAKVLSDPAGVPDAVPVEFADKDKRSPGAIHHIRPASGGAWIGQRIPVDPAELAELREQTGSHEDVSAPGEEGAIG